MHLLPLALIFALLLAVTTGLPGSSVGKRQLDAPANLTLGTPDLTSPTGVETWTAPSWHFPASGPWSHVSKFGNMLYIAGQRGFDQDNDTLVPTNVIPGTSNPNPGYSRIYQAYSNMLDLARAAGASPQDCVRTVVYTTDLYRYRPVANLVTQQLWGNDSVYPTRTIIEVARLNDDDIIEVEGTFAVPA